MTARFLALSLIVCAALASGCQLLGAASYYLGPHRVQPPEYKLPADARVAVVFESMQPSQQHPVVIRAIHERLAKHMKEHKETQAARLVSFENTLRVRREPGFSSWSVQRIGRELDATHVLYVEIEEFRGRMEPEVPVVMPLLKLRFKLIATDAEPDKARVWPPERDGRELTMTRPAEDVTDSFGEDRALRKLGYDTAYFLCAPFIEVDLESAPPRENDR